MSAETDTQTDQFTYRKLKILADKYDAAMYYPEDPDATTLDIPIGTPESPLGDMPPHMVHALEREGAIPSNVSFNSNPTNAELRKHVFQLKNEYGIRTQFTLRVDFDGLGEGEEWTDETPITGGRIFGIILRPGDDECNPPVEAVHLLTDVFARHGASVNKLEQDGHQTVWKGFLD